MKATELRDVTKVFWPSFVTPLVVVASILLGIPWLGVIFLAVILFLPRFWWSWVFGVFNWMVLVGGILGCLIPIVRLLRHAVDGGINSVHGTHALPDGRTAVIESKAGASDISVSSENRPSGWHTRRAGIGAAELGDCSCCIADSPA
jgi:hypothetical protein